MRQATRFVLALILGLAVLTLIAALVVRRTTRAWFDQDLALRAQLAVSGARQALVTRWTHGDWPRLTTLLNDLSRDERILAVAACGLDGTQRAATADYPAQFGCQSLGALVGPPEESPAAEGAERVEYRALHGNDVRLDAVLVRDEGRPLGYVVLVHDLAFAQHREQKTGLFLLGTFAVLALAASAVTVLLARLSWRGWSNELRALLRGGTHRPEFQPLLRDVRELVERISTEQGTEAGGGAWTAARLRQTLQRHLHGERVVVVANREPYIHDRGADGSIRVLHPASGLVTALEPVMRACSGVWVAHGSGTADRQMADPAGRLRVPPEAPEYDLRRVWLTPDEERGYYYGFSNEGLWPLCHVCHTRPSFRESDWQQYKAVNEKFAAAVCEEVDTEDPIILVQDYHFALAPKLIRQRLPRATILTFWHIPWPNAERLSICPWRSELVEGLLGSSIVGFHTQLHCNNFLEAADRFLEARIDREQNAVIQGGRPTLVRPYPISVEWPSRWMTGTPPVEECRREIFAELELPQDALLGVGVDRLDYTKGIEERLLAVERTLERCPDLRGRFVFAQLAAPSRTVIDTYRALNDTVEALAARINQRFGEGSYRPIRLLRRHHEPPSIFRYYRAADLCYVSSIHDGMNLVAKEFISARDDQRGVLVLSHFTGAARELTEALIVNPYDLEEASAALETALRMPAEEQADRMRAMRGFVSEFNVYRWAGRMLIDAARLRSRERLSGRLSDPLRAILGR